MHVKTLSLNVADRDRDTAVKIINRHLIPHLRQVEQFEDASVIDIGEVGLLAIFSFKDDVPAEEGKGVEKSLGEVMREGLFRYGVSLMDDQLVERAHPVL